MTEKRCWWKRKSAIWETLLYSPILTNMMTISKVSESGEFESSFVLGVIWLSSFEKLPRNKCIQKFRTFSRASEKCQFEMHLKPSTICLLRLFALFQLFLLGNSELFQREDAVGLPFGVSISEIVNSKQVHQSWKILLVRLAHEESIQFIFCVDIETLCRYENYVDTLGSRFFVDSLSHFDRVKTLTVEWIENEFGFGTIQSALWNLFCQRVSFGFSSRIWRFSISRVILEEKRSWIMNEFTNDRKFIVGFILRFQYQT